MSTEVTTSKDFQERMFERIRSSMGDLMTDEELKKIVDASLQKAFFEPSMRIDNPGTFNERKYAGPPHIVTLVDELMKPMVKELIKTWLDEHTTDVTALIKERLNKGMLHAVSGAFDSLMSDHFQGFSQGLHDSLRSSGVLR